MTSDASNPIGARLRVAVDLHGVVIEHPEGSRGITEFGWPEVPGAIEWLGAISEVYDVHLVSARFSRPGREGVMGMQAARDWLASRGVPWGWLSSAGGPTRLTFTPYKPACSLWIDDRAFLFEGRFPDAAEIGAFRPWNRRNGGNE